MRNFTIVRQRRRIATLEAHLAEAQERLAMAAEALSKLEDLAAKAATAECNIMAEPPMAGPFGSTFPPRAALLAQAKRAWEEFDEVVRSVLQPTAATVAQHTAYVERRGAAKELRRLAGQMGNQFVGTRRYSTPDLLARAVELEGA